METIDQELPTVSMYFLFSLVATISVVFVISGIMPSFLVVGVLIAAIYIVIGSYYVATSRDLNRKNIYFIYYFVGMKYIKLGSLCLFLF